MLFQISGDGHPGSRGQVPPPPRRRRHWYGSTLTLPSKGTVSLFCNETPICVNVFLRLRLILATAFGTYYSNNLKLKILVDGAFIFRNLEMVSAYFVSSLFF